MPIGFKAIKSVNPGQHVKSELGQKYFRVDRSFLLTEQAVEVYSKNNRGEQRSSLNPRMKRQAKPNLHVCASSADLICSIRERASTEWDFPPVLSVLVPVSPMRRLVHTTQAPHKNN
jgi:hypothetical protein